MYITLTRILVVFLDLYILQTECQNCQNLRLCLQHNYSYKKTYIRKILIRLLYITGYNKSDSIFFLNICN